MEFVKLKDQLKWLLHKHDMSASQLSRKSGVSKQVISQWLNGSSPRKVEQVKKVADVLSTTIDELCFGEKSQSRESRIMDYQDEINAGYFEVVLRRVKNEIKK